MARCSALTLRGVRCTNKGHLTFMDGRVLCQLHTSIYFGHRRRARNIEFCAIKKVRASRAGSEFCSQEVLE